MFYCQLAISKTKQKEVRMARQIETLHASVVARDNCIYEPEISGFDPCESFDLFSLMLEMFEEMKKENLKTLTIALFESGSKGFVPGDFIELLDYSNYYNPRCLSRIEKQMIQLGKHYTRVDLIQNSKYAKALVYKRIRTLGLPGWKKHFGYLTKVFCVSGMELVEMSKSMNQAGITSNHLRSLLKRYDRKSVN